jgi:hypothetical protein
MEANRRLELVDTLLEEVTMKRQVLANTLAAQDVSRIQSQQASQNTSALQEQYTLQAELAWWEKAHQGLTIVQNALAQIEQSERQRGVLTTGAGR